MVKIRLVDLFEKPISGEWGSEPDENSEDTIGIIRTTNFSNDIRIKKDSEIVERIIEDSKVINKCLCYGDIIIEKSGGSPTQPVGRILYYDFVDQKTRLCNNFTSILRPQKGHDNKYLAYLLYDLYKKGVVLSYQNKTTGIINLKLDNYLKGVKVLIPPFQTQKKIVEVLDKAQALIDARKEQIKLLDDLIQSTFYEMFGDPVTNPQGWEKQTLRHIINIVGGYAFKSSEFSNSGIPIIKIGTVNKGYFDTSVLSYWKDEDNEKLNKYVVFPGDLLISLTGTVGKDDYGNICIANDEYKSYYLNQRVARLDIISDINKIFLRYLFLQNKVKKELTKLSRGVRQANISNNDIYGLEIIKPPIDLQNQFAQTVQKIESQKQLMETSLSQMENNYNSLMQRVFKGELFS